MKLHFHYLINFIFWKLHIAWRLKMYFQYIINILYILILYVYLLHSNFIEQENRSAMYLHYFDSVICSTEHIQCMIHSTDHIQSVIRSTTRLNVWPAPQTSIQVWSAPPYITSILYNIYFPHEKYLCIITKYLYF